MEEELKMLLRQVAQQLIASSEELNNLYGKNGDLENICILPCLYNEMEKPKRHKDAIRTAYENQVLAKRIVLLLKNAEIE